MRGGDVPRQWVALPAGGFGTRKLRRNGDQAFQSSSYRTVSFWSRVTSIYAGYKLTQLQARVLTSCGWTPERLQRELWEPRHALSGRRMYDLCLSMRGFYLKAGQFISSRSDFVPDAICRQLLSLLDRVPPMPAALVERALQRELGRSAIEDVFAWVDYEHPLGSASVSQVHLAQLRRSSCLRVAWLRAARFFLGQRSPDARGGVDLAELALQGPRNGLVAVKIQYPEAQALMTQDLRNLRALASFLQRMELAFDLVSAVDELASQLSLEFDFAREAAVMDAVARSLGSLHGRVRVPRSLPALTTPRLLVMDYLEGRPLSQMGDLWGASSNGSASPSPPRASPLGPARALLARRCERRGRRRLLESISDAYGRMVLLHRLFQADSHPGNLLLLKNGAVGILDYGQSKALGDAQARRLARLLLALGRPPRSRSEQEVARELRGAGVVVSSADPALAARLASDMFDTVGRVDPWAADSPIKRAGVSTFPKDLFLVLRVTQLLRGLAQTLGVDDFSCARQWAPFAREALRRAEPSAEEERDLLRRFSQPVEGA